jgi:hypothetical protein
MWSGSDGGDDGAASRPAPALEHGIQIKTKAKDVRVARHPGPAKSLRAPSSKRRLGGCLCSCSCSWQQNFCAVIATEKNQSKCGELFHEPLPAWRGRGGLMRRAVCTAASTLNNTIPLAALSSPRKFTHSPLRALLSPPPSSSSSAATGVAAVG